MFKLNEAPNMVLSAISGEKASRGCGMFWSILCCLPTFGASMACCDDRQNIDYRGCCFPASVSDQSDVTLDVLIDKLNQLRASQVFISKNSEVDERKVIEWQVKETMRLLNAAIAQNIIQGSFRTALINVQNRITTKASTEENYGKVLDSEISPLTGHQPYTPNYGLSK
jgi:hypothetical protein